jgi:diguanylate cyclase (GGDEF)-like protein
MAEHHRVPQPIAMLLADIDNFKEINDRHGHQTGDKVLSSVAAMLLHDQRQSDIAVRWGGEEFLLVLRGCDLAEAARIAENLRQKIAATPIAVNGRQTNVTVSIGVSEYDESELPDQTVDRADAALYEAKKAGRNRVEVAAGQDQA